VLNVLGAISWDPGFRGILVVAVGVLVLMGSVYLLLATNSGFRLGFLLALTGLMGWMTIMGLVWSIYGIGRQGRTPTWHVEDMNFGDLRVSSVEVARPVPEPDQLPDPEEVLASNEDLAALFPEEEGVRRPGLGDLVGADPEVAEELEQAVEDAGAEGWVLLSASDPQTGEAQAAASAYVVDTRKLFESQSDFVVLNSFSYGGKEKLAEDASLLDRIWFKTKRILTYPFGHPTHYAVVQLQQAVPQETTPGEPPPLAVADETKPVISVVMVRDLGTRRLPSVGVTIFSGIVFAILCNSLHRRDKLVAEARAAAGRG
jgi:hypothetical protein